MGLAALSCKPLLDLCFHCFMGDGFAAVALANRFVKPILLGFCQIVDYVVTAVSLVVVVHDPIEIPIYLINGRFQPAFQYPFP